MLDGLALVPFTAASKFLCLSLLTSKLSMQPPPLSSEEQVMTAHCVTMAIAHHPVLTAVFLKELRPAKEWEHLIFS